MNKQKEKGRSVKLFAVVLALTVAVCSIQIIPAFAVGNIEDWRFTRHSDNNGSDLLTEKRPKYDDTSFYIKNDYSEKFVTVTGVACWKDWGAAYYSGGCKPVKALVGQEKYVPSYVHEWGYTHGRLLVWPATHASTKISFLWSPDSI